MLIQSLRAATAPSGWRVLRTAMTIFLVSAIVVFGSQIIVGHPAVAQNGGAVINAPITPENQSKDNLYITDLTLRAVGDKTGKQPLAVNDTAAQVELKWDNAFAGTPESKPTAGKKFSLELPEVLFFYEPALTPGGPTGTPIAPVPMKHEDGSVLGECVFEPRKATCSFNDAVETLWANGTRNFKGTFSSWATVAVPTDGTKTTETFKLNDTNLDITLPGGVIKDQAGPLTGTPWYKSANSVKEGQETITWYFKVTGPYLKKAFADKGINQVMDGATPFTIVIKDVALTDALYLPEDQGDLYFTRVINKGTCSMEQVINKKRGSECGNVTEKIPGSTIEYKADPNDQKRGEIHITAAFKEDEAYSIGGLKTQVVGNAVKDKEYKNSGQLFLKQPDGSLQQLNDPFVKRTGVDNKQKVTVEFDKNSGSFELEKGIKGDILAVDPNVANNFEYTYELPTGTTFNDWMALEPLKNASKDVTENSGVAQLSVLPFKKAVPQMPGKNGDEVPVPFPIGTKITLREVIDPVRPIKDVAVGEQSNFWGEPSYFFGDEKKAPEFEIKQGLTQVRAENVVDPGVPVFVEKAWDGIEDKTKLPPQVNFNYVCVTDDNQQGDSFDYDVRRGGKQLIGYFKAGTECRFTEDVAGLTIDNIEPAVSWDKAGDPAAPQGLAYADKDDESRRTAIATNTYRQINGTFKVQKQVTGVEANAGDGKVFKFAYTCEDGQNGELDVPGNGEAIPVGKQFKIGTKCDINEVAPAEPIENHQLVITPPAQKVTIAAEEQTAVFTNTYKPLGTFEVVKRVEGIEEPALLDAKAFEFDYVCTVNGVAEPGKIVGVKHDGTPMPAGKSFPKGTTCEVTEIAASAQVEGYTAVIPSKVSVVVGGPNEPVGKAEFLNKYTRDTGLLKLRKVVTGENRFAADNFKVEYRCGEGDWVQKDLPGDGSWVEVSGIKTGSKCEVREDREMAERLGYALAVTHEYADNNQAVQKDKPVEVTVKNNYTQADADFVIAKSLEGDVNDAIRNKDFTFNYKCTQPNGEVKSDTVKLKGGETKKVKGIQKGSTCEVEEANGAVDNTDWTLDVNLVEGPVPAGEADDELAPEPAAVAAVPVAEKILAQENEGEVNGDDAAPADDNDKPGEASPAAPAANEPDAANQPPAAPVAPEAPQPVAQQGGVEDGKAKFTVMGQSIAVTFTNKYVQHFGGLSVTKNVTGDAGDALRDKAFTFNVKCTNGMADTLSVPGDGKAVVSQLKLPLGTQCDIEEDVEAAKLAAFDLKAPAKQTVTISNRDEVVASTFTNEYIAHKGTFSVAKKVKGLPEATAKDKEFTFNYVCTDDQKGQVKAKGDGVPVDSGVMVRNGVECILTEDVESAQVKGYTLGLPEAHIVRIENKDQKVEVTFTNEYGPEPKNPPIFDEHDPKTPPTPDNQDPKPPSPWYLLPFVPFLFGGGSSGGSSSGSHSSTQVPHAPQQTEAKNVSQKRNLASTGASVIGIGLVAMVITTAGIILAVRSRRNKN